MRVEIQGPVEFAGDLMSDVTGLRGRMNGMETKGATQVIRAMIPMSEMLTYQNDLTAKTQGRGSLPPARPRSICAARRGPTSLCASSSAAHTSS